MMHCFFPNECSSLFQCRPGHSLGGNKELVAQNGKGGKNHVDFWFPITRQFLIEHFIKHKPLIYEE